MNKTLSFLLGAACACGSGSSSAPNRNPNCQPGSSTALNTTCDPGFNQNTIPKPDIVYVTFSGEALGVNGLPFPAQGPQDPFFVDGWSLSFDEILVVLGNFRLSPGATSTPDQKTISAPVATMPGPYVVDMHNPNGFTGKGGAPERAGPIFKWDTDDDGKAFDTNTRYAFSYDVMKAVHPATQVNLTSAQFADYDLMVKNGWSKLYRGTATYTGADPATMPFPAAVQGNFKAMPGSVHFLFGWSDAGSHLDCINPDFGNNEDLANRGVQPTSSGPVIAQATLHTDHLFWDILVEHDNVELRFDPIAAWATAANSDPATPLDLRTLANKPLATTFADGTPLPDRGQFQNPATACDTPGRPCAQVTMNLNGVPADRAPGLGNFMAFSAQSQMHLNSDGLCYDVGQHAPDPYFAPGL